MKNKIQINKQKTIEVPEHMLCSKCLKKAKEWNEINKVAKKIMKKAIKEGFDLN